MEDITCLGGAPRYINMDAGPAEDITRDIAGAIGAARDGSRTLIRWEGKTLAVISPVAGSPGAETVTVTVRFADRAEAIPLAVSRARELYGDDAPLTVVSVGKIWSGNGPSRFLADVTLRCDELPAELAP